MVDEVPNEKKGKKNHSKGFSKKMKKNPWIPATFVLAVIVILILSTGFSFSHVPERKASEDLVEFINSELGGQVSYASSKDFGSGLYEVTVEASGQQVPTYITKDGKYFAQVVPITPNVVDEGGSETDNTQPEAEAQDIPKKDVPKLEAFVSPYCPYGLQYMKGLIPVYDLLKDESEIHLNYMGITHMQEEELETKRRLCIIEEYDEETLFDYTREIIYNEVAQECYNVYHGVNLQTGESISSEDVKSSEYFNECMNPIIESALNKVSVDSNILDKCIKDEGDDLFSESREYAQSLGVRGSPTPLLNGVKISGRSPELIKNAICSSFSENSLPEVCSENLSSETPSPGISPLSEISSSGSSSGAC